MAGRKPTTGPTQHGDASPGDPSTSKATAESDDAPDVICVPMNVDAFILNEKVCDTGLARIAPITQPDYRGLRLNSAEIQHDILPHVDMHRTQPASVNSRISAVETPNLTQINPSLPSSDTDASPPLRSNRVGVYVHWSLPRMYRAATSAADSVEDLDTGENTSASPTFRLVPNRWLVIRKVTSSTPAAGRQILTAWVIESDRLWKISDLAADVDLETDVSPFVSYTSGDESDPNALNKQAAVFIGAKYPSVGWTETSSTVPRVPLTIMNSSNFCFADNAVHNPNVLSLVDNFAYTNIDGVTQYYTQVTCNYTVIGWHSSAADDPLGPNGLKGTLADRLKILFCYFADNRAALEWQNSILPTRLVCYGTVLNVQYVSDAKPTTPSEQFASLFTSAVQMEPVSIGTTAIDSVLTFLQAHSANEDDILGTGTSAVAKDILALSELLYASEDTYNSRVKAADLIYANSFASSAGGNQWHYSVEAGAGQPPAQPGTVSVDGSGLSPLDYLNKVNDLQLQLDAAMRKLQFVQWSLFALWWKFVSDPNNSNATEIASYQAQVTNLRNLATGLNTVINDPTEGLVSHINLIVRNQRRSHGPIFVPKVRARSIALPPYYQRKDPTICIAGMDSGWPAQYLGEIPVQIDFELNPPTTTTTSSTTTTTPVGAQILAFEPFTTPASSSASIDPQILAALQNLLEYAVTGTVDHSSDIGFKIWTGQPWCPLYIEWEATYFHIPFEKWSVQILNSPVGNNHDQVRYGLKDPLYNDPNSAADQRTVSGRIIVTPQPAFNLQALVAQVLGTAGVQQPTNMSAADLVAKTGALKLLSSELTGLTDNLITLADGAHVQPNLHIPGETTVTPISAAVSAGAAIGLTAADLNLIGDQSGSTPYGSLVDFSKALKEPFIPVTHGQFRFTKLNIIDKFGQVVSGIQPTPEPRVPSGLPPSLHPCLGDQVCPGLVSGTTNLNTVTALTSADPQLPGGYPLCPYIQLTPSINQFARLNAAFLEPLTDADGKFTAWKTTSEWEQPVWAWIVINYADYGLQFFTSDGTFYVELSLGGPTGTINSTKWLPFDPPQNPSQLVSPQLQQLIGNMTGTGGDVYLRSFWDMITKAVESMPYAPADYASYASSIVGKPLALVNVGFSLELATPPLQSQTTLPPTSDGDLTDLLSYAFPIKIGDADRPFDGVVGFFQTDNTTTGATDWTKLYTYFPQSTTSSAPQGDPRIFLEPSTFQTLSPFFIDPDGPLKNDSYAASLAAEYQVKTLLIDPYTPLHVYSPILPITELPLPSWTVQVALQKMSAFFKLGPCLITRDIPATYNATQPLEADSWVSTQQALSTSIDTAPIRLPLLTGKKGRWNWLQPYAVGDSTAGGGSGSGGAGTKETRYNALEVGEDDGRIRLDPAPYTLVEGFLQLVQPFVSSSTSTSTGTNAGGVTGVAPSGSAAASTSA